MTNDQPDQPDQSVYHRTLHQISFGLSERPTPEFHVRATEALAGLNLIKVEVKGDGEVTLVGGKHALITAVLWFTDLNYASYATRRAAMDMLLERD
jgi:hypothetical protein